MLEAGLIFPVLIPFPPMKMLLPALSLVCLATLPVIGEVPGPGIVPALYPFVENHVMAGAVTLVANKDKVLGISMVGYEDVATQKRMQRDSLFWIASMSKAITCAGVMMLVDEGKVNVDDPVEKYLPEFKGQMVIAEKAPDHVLLQKPVHPITVKNVLSHTSGLPFKTALEQPTLDILPLAARVRSYAMTPLEFEPDSKYQYSNAGINTGGRIIEVVSGMSYEDFLQKRLFDPLGMKDTTFWPTKEQQARLAKSYRANKDKSDIEETNVGQLQYPLEDRVRQPMPAGGLFATADDVAKFCQMLLNHGMVNGKRILSEAAVQAMTTRETPAQLPQSYGFGLQVSDKGFGHGGAYSTNMAVNTQNGLITVFMVQNAGWRNDDGKKILPTFTRVAEEAFVGK
jgi:CubicO group peptidase (beta-lactamase class C family)